MNGISTQISFIMDKIFYLLNEYPPFFFIGVRVTNVKH